MTIGILIFSHPKQDAFTNVVRLEQAAVSKGHKVVRLYEPYFTFIHNSTQHDLQYENKPVPQVDVIIARPNFCQEPGLHRLVVESLQKAGHKVINGSEGLFLAKNKLKQHIHLSEAKIPTPNWAIAHSPKQACEVVKEIGFPCMIKVAFGTLGTGVFYAENLETFSPIVDYLAIRDGNPVIIQEFIKEANRKDVRIFVIGDKVVAAMERKASKGDVRSNIGKGAEGQPIELTSDEIDLAIKTTKAFDLDIAGVDILRSNRGPLVIEINANPGFKELEQAVNVDVASAIVDYVVSAMS